MAIPDGRLSVLKVTDSGATLRDISIYVTDYDFDYQADTRETTTKGQTARTRLGSHTSWTLSVSGRWDSTATTGPDVILSGILGNSAGTAVEIGLEGGTTGKVKYSGTAILTSYHPSSPLEDVVGWSATFEGTGALTRGTFA